MKLHHVGIVCNQEFITRFEHVAAMFDTQRGATKDVPEFGCVCYMYGQVELIVPYEGTLLRRLQDVGTHIHHFALETSDVRNTSQNFRDVGYRIVTDDPAEGVGNTLVNFMHPLELGVMVEFVQCMK